MHREQLPAPKKDFFADFLVGFFLLIFVGKVPRKILQENPRENLPKFIQQKSSNTFLQIGRGKVSESTASNTELSEFFGPHRAPGRELSEFLSAYYLCAKGNSPNSPLNSPSLPQNSVSSLFRNSALETVFRPFPWVSNMVQERKSSPKSKFLGRISRGHPGVIRADIPAQNFGQGAQNPGKTSIWAWTPLTRARTSTTRRDFQKLRSEKLWAEFSFPNCKPPVRGVSHNPKLFKCLVTIFFKKSGRKKAHKHKLFALVNV